MSEEVKIYSTEIVIGNKSFFGLDKDLVNLVENLTIDKLNAELKRDKYKIVLDKIKDYAEKYKIVGVIAREENEYMKHILELLEEIDEEKKDD